MTITIVIDNQRRYITFGRAPAQQYASSLSIQLMQLVFGIR